MHTKKKQNGIYVAFPGMGKTTYALCKPGAVDLDFGNFRSAMRVKKEDDSRLLLPFSRLITYYYRDGFNVFTNEPALIPLLKQNGGMRISVVLPSNPDELVERVIQRSKGANYHSREFASDLKKHIDEWLQDWAQIALRYGISIIWSNYLEEAIYDDERD